MRILMFFSFSLGTIAACLAPSAAQAQPKPAKCTLPPPLVCPPEPPNGPRTVEEVDSYLKGVDNALTSLGAVPGKAWQASPGAKAGFIAYAGELKEHREKVADYRDKISPMVDPGQAAAQISAPDGPE